MQLQRILNSQGKTTSKIVFLLFFNLLILKSFGQGEIYDNSHYLFPEFTNGVVKLKSGITIEVPLNYSMVLDEMQFKENGELQKIGDLNIVDTVFIDDRKFVFHKKEVFELLMNSTVPLYVQHFGKVLPPAKTSAYGGRSQTTAIDNHRKIIVGGISYDLSLPEDYKITTNQRFWLKRNGKFIKANSTKQVIKAFPTKKEFIKSYNKSQTVDFENARDVIQLIYLCNK